MTRTTALAPRPLFLAAALALFSSCAQRAWMMVPPQFDLGLYERIGLVQFHCADPALRDQATRHFQEMVLDARPGSQIVLVGEPTGAGEAGAWDPDGLDPALVRELAERHDLDALFVGALEMSDVSPTIGIRSSLVELNARAEIVGTMSARLIEPQGGGTLWIRSADQRATVASGGLNTDGQGSFGMTDPQGVRQAMVRTLATNVTHDFRARYYRKRLDDIPPDYRATYPDGVEVYVPPEVQGRAR